jgi:hypothetical protein
LPIFKAAVSRSLRKQAGHAKRRYICRCRCRCDVVVSSGLCEEERKRDRALLTGVLTSPPEPVTVRAHFSNTSRLLATTQSLASLCPSTQSHLHRSFTTSIVSLLFPLLHVRPSAARARPASLLSLPTQPRPASAPCLLSFEPDIALPIRRCRQGTLQSLSVLLLSTPNASNPISKA